MNLLLVITKSNWGGAQRYVYDLAIAARRAGHTVSVVAGGGDPLLEKLKEEGLSTYSLGSAQRDVNFVKDGKTFFDLMRLIKKTDADVIHVNSSKLGGIGVVAGLLLRKKTVFTAHGWPFQERRSKLATMFIWLLSWLTGLLSHRVIVPSANDFRLAKKMPLIGRKTRLVYLGRDIKFCNREESRVHIAGLVKKEVSVNIPWICVLAELHANKGHRFLIEAAKSIPAQLFFVGGGEIGAQLKNQARGLGVLDKIFFLGHIDDAATYLPAFDCMVLPSLKEGLPYTLIEAGLAGIPALASNVGGIPEIIVNQAMLFESGSAQEMRISVNKFLQLSRDDCRVIRSEFQAHVQERFSKQRMIVETLRVYQEVL